MPEIEAETKTDLVTEVEELLAKRRKINRYVKSVECNYAPCENCKQDWCGCECHDPDEEELSELLRRLVEEVKRTRQFGCEHCDCTCNSCAPCGEKEP